MATIKISKKAQKYYNSEVLEELCEKIDQLKNGKELMWKAYQSAKNACKPSDADTYWKEYMALTHDIKVCEAKKEEIEIVLSGEVYMNKYVGSDCYPFEVLEILSPSTFVIREMIAENCTWKNKSVSIGGFCAHVEGDQEWEYKSDESAPSFRVKRTKRHGFSDGHWKNYYIHSKPIKYWDPNF